MYICLCHGITEKQIRSCVQSGARTLCDLRGQLGVATRCRSCESQASELLNEALRTGGMAHIGRDDCKLNTTGIP